MDPPPRRDIRWIMIVLGISFLIVAGLFLALGAVVGSVLSGRSSSCPGPGCGSSGPATWLEWFGVPFLVLGLVLVGLGLWWALRGPAPAR